MEDSPQDPQPGMVPIRHDLVDLVIPVYNEAAVLERSLQRLLAAMAGWNGFQGRIVVVNNGSTDDTLTIGRRLVEQLPEVTLLHLDAKGRGRALRTAWKNTSAEYSLYMDVDLSTDLDAVPTVVEILHQGADLVTGSRLHPESTITRCLKREVLSRAYNTAIRWTLHTQTFDDAQCGFKGVRVETIRQLLPLVKNEEWFFDTELLVLAEYAGLRVRSVPIAWVEDPDSRVNIPATIWEDIRGLVRLRRTARNLTREWKG